MTYTTLTSFQQDHPLFVGDKVAFMHEQFESSRVGKEDSEWGEADDRLVYHFREMKNDTEAYKEISLATVAFVTEKNVFLSQLYNGFGVNYSGNRKTDAAYKSIEIVFVRISWDDVKKLMEADRLRKLN